MSNRAKPGGRGRDTVRVEYRLLGPVEVRRDGELIELGVRQRALMALLLIHANQVVSTDRIIDELWGAESGSDRKRGLWVVVSRLRSALEPDRDKRSDGTILITQLPGYRIAVDPAQIDVQRFETLVDEGRRVLDDDPEAAAALLREALALWRGNPLEEFTYEPFATAEIARLTELRMTAVESRIEADLRLGRWQDLASELEGLVIQHPLRQTLVGHQMRALYLASRQGEALRVFEQLRTRLVEEVGLDPSSELTELEAQILTDDPALRSEHPATTIHRPRTGLSVRGYELRDQIGSGAMGSVYRAYQPAVGRQVAIKVIRPELANEPDFIRRFEVEAQMIAQLEHPQIVPIFDFWREPDNAFLVMRHFEHGTLSAAIEAGPLSRSTAMTIIQQVGAALIAAHRRSITHGDLKPGNVMLDADGNAYLADFGVSSTDSSSGDESPLTAPPDVRSDTRFFAQLTEFVLRNAADAHDAVGGPVADVLARATSTDDERFPDVQSFLGALTDALEDRTELVPSDVGAVPNPYQGLRAFGEDDAGLFFGRERLVDRLITRLGHNGPQGRFVAVVGPSGSGKSSVVRAGVVPALRHGAVVDSARWFIVTMTPGTHPFDSLAEAVRTIAVRPPADLSEHLAADGIPLTVERISPDPSAQVLIVVDQFEELFTLADADDAEAFIDELVRAVEDRHSGVRVIATLRADFYDRPLRHRKLGELLRLGTELITPMTPEEIQRAITEPAREVGVSYEPGAVARIASDMTGQPTALPMMQHALTEMFDNRVGATITADSYLELGGLSGAVARRADALHDEFGLAQRGATRDLFLRLATVHEGTANTRRRAPIRELVAAAGPDARSVLDAFGRHRLLSFDRDPQTREPTVEIAHEALLTSWGRLRQWLEESHSAVLAQRRLAEAAAEWSAQGGDPELVLARHRLRHYEGWVDEAPVRLTEQEQAFLAASHDASTAELETERRRVRRLRRLVSIAVLAFLIATVAAGTAFWQWNRAADASDAADLERMRAQSAATIQLNAPLAALLAVESYNLDPSAASADALHKVLVDAGGLLASMSEPEAVYLQGSALAGDHTLVAVSATAVDIWDLESRALRHRLPADVAFFSVSHDGRLVVVSEASGSWVASTETGGVLSELPGRHFSTQFSPDGTELAALAAGNTLEIWDLVDPGRPALLEERTQGEDTFTVDWSPDGRSYLTSTSSGVVYWDRATGDQLWRFAPEGKETASMTSDAALFRTDGRAVVVALTAQGAISSRVFTLDTRDGTLVHPPTNGQKIRKMTWWDEDAEQIVGTFQPTGVVGFDLVEAREIPFPIVAPSADDLHVDRARDRVVTTGAMGVEVRSLDGLSALERRVELTREQREVQDALGEEVFAAISRDGETVLLSVFDMTSTSPVVEYDLTANPPTGVERFSTGFVAGYGEYALYWNLGSGTAQVLDGDFEPYGEPADMGLQRGLPPNWQLSGDGSTHVAQRPNGFIDVYDTLSGELVVEIDTNDLSPGAPHFEMSISHDGDTVMAAFGPDFPWGMFDTRSGELVRSGDGGEVRRPWLGGNNLYSQAVGNVLERLDPETLSPIGPPLVGSTLNLNDIQDDPGGSVVFTQATNGTVRAWDRESGDQIGREIVIGQTPGFVIDSAPDGRALMVVRANGVAIWNYDLDSWGELACELAGRNMTQREWDEFGPRNTDYRVTCPELPTGK